MSNSPVHFVRGGGAYLPELDAYARHLASMGREANMHADAGSVPRGARVVWWICGRVPRDAAARWPAAFHVHEYASASVPPLALLKDRVKRWTHPRPQHRIFQNEWVRQRMGFQDGVPHSLRDMGVPSHFLDAKPAAVAEFDLVYLGETSRLAQFARAIEAIRAARLKLLVVGSVHESVRELLDKPGIECCGRVAQQDVPVQLLRARAGLNLMPARLPFSEQTSTKLLEYLAVGLPVLGNDYAWFRHAASEHAGRIRAVEVDDPAAWRSAVDALPPVLEARTHLQSLTWDARFRDLPVWDALP